jgi:EAL domain-containing protein (putative c-di-GMP-specific phosphodiesterase class I)
MLTGAGMRSFFQPIHDVAAGGAVGFEALSRFSEVHERGPAGWFSDAFDVGLGVDLELRAISLATSYPGSMPPPELLAVNMSPASILELGQREPICPEPAQGFIAAEVNAP